MRCVDERDDVPRRIIFFPFVRVDGRPGVRRNRSSRFELFTFDASKLFFLLHFVEKSNDAGFDGGRVVPSCVTNVFHFRVRFLFEVVGIDSAEAFAFIERRACDVVAAFERGEALELTRC